MSEPSTTAEPMQAASIELSRTRWRNEQGVLVERVDSLLARPIGSDPAGRPRVALHAGAYYRQVAEEPKVCALLRKRQPAWEGYP